MTPHLRAALAIIWLAGGIAAYIYSQQLTIPARIAVPVAVAFLAEISLYAALNASFWTPARLWISSLASYLIYSIPTGQFSLPNLALLAAITGIAILWMRYVPAGLAPDLLFLGLFAALYIAKVPQAIFAEPGPKVQTPALAQLLCFRLLVGLLLRYRTHADLGFGFIPTRADWRIGLRYFLYFAPIAAAGVYLLELRAFRLATGIWWRAPLTFIGILWVVALGEEFLFRGLLLHRLRALMPPTPALAVASLAFGAVHLWFPPFPNWKFVILASAAGVFYGLAYLEARTVRAAMVAHALTVTAWRTFLA